MDQVKKYLQLVQKHHFWLLCVVAAILALVVWKMSTGKLATEFASKSGEIDSQITGLKKVLTDDLQAHTDWPGGVDKQTDMLRADVRKAWDELYKQQKAQIFIWPPALGSDFIKQINATEGTKTEIPRRLLNHYLNTVKSFVTDLSKIVDSEPPDANAVGVGVGSGMLGGLMAPMINNGGHGAAGPMAGPMAGPAAVPMNAGNHVVIWDSNSINTILRTFDWQLQPSTLIVRFAQEELWVYQALCNVIKTVNEGATSNGDAPIKVIQDMKIAYLASDSSPFTAGQKRVYPLASSGDAPSTNDKEKPPDPTSRCREGDRGGLFAPAENAQENPDDKWKKYRYVDAKGVPLIDAAAVDSPAQENKQYNLMPFQLNLAMDPRYIDRLLVAFRNSPLPMEVQEVRISPQSAVSGYSGIGGHPIIAGATAQQQDRVTTVAIHGVVYLIKPVDPTDLQTAPAGDAPAPDAAAPGGAPTAAAAPTAAGPNG